MHNAYALDKRRRGVTPLGALQMVRKKSRSTWKGADRIRGVLRTKDATWADLRQQAVHSHTLLSGYLQDLQKDGFVFKGLIDGKYSSYERADQLFAHQLDNSIVYSDELLFVKDFLKDNTSLIDAERFKEKAIRASAMLLTASIPAIIYNTLRRERIPAKGIDDLVALSCNDMIDIFIRPWIHNLLELCLLDKELAERIAIEISNSIYAPAFREYEEYIEILRKLL
jgi:hypothetical protein